MNNVTLMPAVVAQNNRAYDFMRCRGSRYHRGHPNGG